MKTHPKVSVLLPVFNAQNFVKEAIDSILQQTFSDFELIIINDGSTDNSSKIISEFHDDRIIVINHEENKGLIFSLNEGLDLSLGEYIVRMDADDFSLPERLSIQVDFMDINKDIVVSGGQMIDYENKIQLSNNPIVSDEVKAALLFSCVISHPTVIIRSAIFKKEKFYYDKSYIHSEDYELWSRVIKNYKVSNVSNVILKYRIHQNQVSQKFSKVQVEGIRECQKKQLIQLGINPTKENLYLHNSFSQLDFTYSKNYLLEVEQWFLQLINQNNVSGYYDKRSLRIVIFRWWMNVTGSFLNKKVPVKLIVLKSRLTYSRFDVMIYLKLLVKFIIK
jgi:glycosyltransferase involved in cell wall biosynthesis